MKNNQWVKIGVLAAGLVGASVAAGVVIKKQLAKRGEQVMFESYDSDDWDQDLADTAPVSVDEVADVDVADVAVDEEVAVDEDVADAEEVTDAEQAPAKD